MATPTVRELLRGTAANANITVTTGAGTAVADVLVVIHASDYFAAANMVAPTGTAGTWTQQALGDIGASNSHVKCWTRPVTSSGAQTVTVTKTGDNDHGVQLYVLAGVDTSSPVDAATGTSGAASTSHVAPSVSPATADALLLCAVVSEVNSFGNYTAVSGGMTDLTEDDLTPTSTFATLASARQALVASGATGTRTFTYSQSRAFAAVSVALKAAAGGGASVAPDGLVVPVALGSPALTWSGSIAPDGISVPVALGAPIVGAASIDPGGIAVPVTLGAPALAWSGSVAPDGIAAPVVLGSPIVGAAGLAPDGIAVPVSLGAPAVAWSATVAPDGISALVVLGAPIIGAASLAPDGMVVPVAVGFPSLAWSGSVSPDGISVPVALGAPSLSVPGAVVARPNTGTVARPAAGLVIRPDTGVVVRP